MAVATREFTTGPSTLPDIGELSYNGCVFSPLFETTMSGRAEKDRANRTIKYIEYTLTADGYVTLPAGISSIDSAMTNLRQMLQAQAGILLYRGRGFDLHVNAGRGDVAWGPIPELLEFQPLGAGRSAKVRWVVITRVTEPAVTLTAISNVRGLQTPVQLLQFNYETSVTYGEDGYSTLSVSGTLEIAMTRSTQKDRTVPITADNLRPLIESNIMVGVDLSRFRMTNRDFNVSRDKRTLEWNFTAEETPYMDMPPFCTIAKGTYSVKPVTAGMGLARWMCTLRATYTVRADKPRRLAWLAFLALVRLRMQQSVNAAIPKPDEGEGFFNRLVSGPLNPFNNPIINPLNVVDTFRKLINQSAGGLIRNIVGEQAAWLIDFTIDEGLYLDSKTISFSATWRLVTAFSHILLASGIWKKLPEKDANGNNLWAMSMTNVSGAKSWLANTLDPSLDVIVDFGGS